MYLWRYEDHWERQECVQAVQNSHPPASHQHTHRPRAAPPACLLKGFSVISEPAQLRRARGTLVLLSDYGRWRGTGRNELFFESEPVFKRLGSLGFETARLISCLTHTGQHGWLISMIDSLERCSRHRLSGDQHAETHRYSYMYDLTCALWSACFKRYSEK